MQRDNSPDTRALPPLATPAVSRVAGNMGQLLGLAATPGWPDAASMGGTPIFGTPAEGLLFDPTAPSLPGSARSVGVLQSELGFGPDDSYLGLEAAVEKESAVSPALAATTDAEQNAHVAPMPTLQAELGFGTGSDLDVSIEGNTASQESNPLQDPVHSFNASVQRAQDQVQAAVEHADRLSTAGYAGLGEAYASQMLFSPVVAGLQRSASMPTVDGSPSVAVVDRVIAGDHESLKPMTDHPVQWGNVLNPGYGSILPGDLAIERADLDVQAVEALVQDLVQAPDAAKIVRLGTIAQHLAQTVLDSAAEIHKLEKNATVMQERELDLAESELLELANKVQSSEEEILALQQELQAAREIETKIQRENEAQAACINQQNEMLVQLRDAQAALESEDSHTHSLVEQVAQLQADKTELSRKLTEAVQESRDTLNRAQVAEERVKTLVEDTASAMEERDRVLNKLDELSSAASSMGDSVIPAQRQKIEELNTQVVELNAKLTAFTEKDLAAAAATAKVTAELEVAQSALESQQAESDAAIEAMRCDLVDADERAMALQVELNEAKSAAQQQHEQYSQSIHTTNEDAAKTISRLQAQLHESDKAATAAADACSAAEAKLARIEAEALDVTAVAADLEAIASEDKRMLTVEKEKAEMLSENMQQKLSQASARILELESQSDQYDRAQTTIAELSGKLEQLETMLSDVTQSRDRAEAKVADNATTLADRNAEIALVKSSLEKANAKVDELSLVQKDLTQKLSKAMLDAAAARQKHGVLEGELSDQLVDTIDTAQEINELRAEVAILRSLPGRAEAEAAMAEQQSVMSSERAQFAQQLAAASAQLTLLQDSEEALKEQLVETEVELQTIHDREEALRKQHDAESAAKAALEEEVTAIRRRMDDLTRERSTLVEKAALEDATSELEKSLLRIENLKQAVAELKQSEERLCTVDSDIERHVVFVSKTLGRDATSLSEVQEVVADFVTQKDQSIGDLVAEVELRTTELATFEKHTLESDTDRKAKEAELTAALESVEKQFGALKEKASQLEHDLASKQGMAAEFERQAAQLLEAEDKLLNVESERAELKTSVEDAQAQLVSAVKDRESAQAELNQLRQQLAAKDVKDAAAQATVDETSCQPTLPTVVVIEDVEVSIADRQSAIRKGEVYHLQSGPDNFGEVLINTKDNVISVPARSVADVEHVIEQLAADNAKLNETTAELDARVESLRQHVDELQSMNNDLQQRSASANDIMKAEAGLAAAEAAARDALAESADLSQEVQSMKEKLVEAQRANSLLEYSAAEHATQLQRLGQHNATLQSKADALFAEKEAALTARDDALQKLNQADASAATNSSEAAEYNISHLVSAVTDMTAVNWKIYNDIMDAFGNCDGTTKLVPDSVDNDVSSVIAGLAASQDALRQGVAAAVRQHISTDHALQNQREHQSNTSDAKDARATPTAWSSEAQELQQMLQTYTAKVEVLQTQLTSAHAKPVETTAANQDTAATVQMMVTQMAEQVAKAEIQRRTIHDLQQRLATVEPHARGHEDLVRVIRGQRRTIGELQVELSRLRVLQKQSESNSRQPDSVSDANEVRNLYIARLRVESKRKALAYQKRYLIMAHGESCGEVHSETLARIASHTTALTPVARFRAVALAVVGIARMRILKRRWDKVSRA